MLQKGRVERLCYNFANLPCTRNVGRGLQLYHSARERELDDRSLFLAEACERYVEA